MNRKIRILVVRPSKSSFIQRDLELLRKHFDVRVGDFVLGIRRRCSILLQQYFFNLLLVK
jgi:hypothetical protein